MSGAQHSGGKRAMMSKTTALGALVAASAALVPLNLHAAPPRGPLVAKDPAAVPCTHPSTTLDGHVTLDAACIYPQTFTIGTSDTTLDCNGAQIEVADGYGVNVNGQISNVTVQNFRACRTPWGHWLHHGDSTVAYQPDGALPSGCAEEIRSCTDGSLDGSFVDEICSPAEPVDGGTVTPDAGTEPDGATNDGAVTDPDPDAPPDEPISASAPSSGTSGGCQVRPSPSATGFALLFVGVLPLLRRRGAAGRAPGGGIAGSSVA